MQHLQIEQVLGLTPGSFPQVVHTLCEDLLMGAYGSGSMICSVDPATLAALLAELDEPAMQAKVLRLASAAAEADQHLADAEALLVAAVCQHWRVSTPHRPALRRNTAGEQSGLPVLRTFHQPSARVAAAAISF